MMARKPDDPFVVLDPFCGSGTTLVAAEKLGRQWIGIEQSPRGVEIARDRVKREASVDVIRRTDPPARTDGQ